VIFMPAMVEEEAVPLTLYTEKGKPKTGRSKSGRKAWT
jgi:hypothetical protein